MRVWRRVRTASVLLFLLIAYMALAVTSLRRKSATFDEVAYLAAGYVHLRLADYRMIAEEPPLVRSAAALPLLSMDVRLKHDTSDRYWRKHRHFEWGRRFLYQWNDADRLLFAARLVVVSFGALLIVAVFLWTGRRFGYWPALLAAYFCALSPDVLAHGRLVTTDIAIALLYFLSVAGFHALCRRVTRMGVLATGLALGAAFATKMSALGLVPILAAISSVVVFSGVPMEITASRRGSMLVSRRSKAVALLVIGALSAAIALVVVWGSYGFHRSISTDRSLADALDWSDEAPSSVLAARVIQGARQTRIFPEGYLFGLSRFLKYSAVHPAFLCGRRSRSGWWYFFPVTFAIKTPIPFIVLIVFGIAAVLRRCDRLTSSSLLLPVVVYGGMTMTRSLNIGHRHLLPIYPFLFIVAALGAASAWRSGKRLTRALVIVALFWYALGTVKLHPHYLAYFNELAGGPRNGYKYLVDSNLDWGQDLIGLKDYMRAQRIPSVKLSYFGTAEPSYYGIPCERLPGHPMPRPAVRQVRRGDVLAVSATHLQGLYLDDAALRLMRRLHRRSHLAQIGYSIFVYRADFDLDFE
jgi:hypothetical protein